MTARKLTPGRKLLSIAAGMVTLAGPIVFEGRAQPQSGADAALPSFEVASIKLNHSGERRIALMLPPGRMTATNVTLKFLVEFAYDIKDSEISGGPGWIDSDRYDLEAKVEESDADARKPTPDERTHRIRLMLRSLLADRFKLTLNHATQELPIYVLVVGKNGPKFHESEAAPPDPPGAANSGPAGPGGQRMVRMSRGEINMSSAPIGMFAGTLSTQLGRKVLDETGLKGNYDIALKWTPDSEQRAGAPGDGGDGKATPPPDASGPSIFTALQEQLGLKLESKKGPVETFVIARVEKPSDN